MCLGYLFLQRGFYLPGRERGADHGSPGHRICEAGRGPKERLAFCVCVLSVGTPSLTTTPQGLQNWWEADSSGHCCDPELVLGKERHIFQRYPQQFPLYKWFHMLRLLTPPTKPCWIGLTTPGWPVVGGRGVLPVIVGIWWLYTCIQIVIQWLSTPDHPNRGY